MALSKITVTQIIEIVANDPECKQRVNSWLGKIPTDTGTAGVIRNYAIGFADVFTFGKIKSLDPSERDQIAYLYSCDGIAEATSNAIKKQIKAVPHLASVDAQAREKGFSHTGTMITMDDNSRYFLDWWKSLNVREPIVFQYRNFMLDLGGGIPYSSFNGFN